jgi:hypothetical protein
VKEHGWWDGWEWKLCYAVKSQKMINDCLMVMYPKVPRERTCRSLGRVVEGVSVVDCQWSSFEFKYDQNSLDYVEKYYDVIDGWFWMDNIFELNKYSYMDVCWFKKWLTCLSHWVVDVILTCLAAKYSNLTIPPMKCRESNSNEMGNLPAMSKI